MSRILIVEDEPVIRMESRRMLTRAGYDVAEAASVQQAEADHDLTSFDLVLSDLRLPGSSGTELIAKCAPTSLSSDELIALDNALEARARQDPVSTRDHSPNVLQPAILANGVVGVWLTRLSDDHAVTALALKDLPLDRLLDELFLRTLTRLPTPEERKTYTDHLRRGYDTRLRQPKAVAVTPRQPAPYVSWSNHLDPEATVVRHKQEEAARRGDPADDVGPLGFLQEHDVGRAGGDDRRDGLFASRAGVTDVVGEQSHVVTR